MGREIGGSFNREGIYVYLWLKLKLQYFGHLMQRVDSLEKTLMLGGIGLIEISRSVVSNSL